MANTAEQAHAWVSFLASRPEFPAAARLLAAMGDGTITRLCDCGCHSFDFCVRENAAAQPLCPPGAYGAVFKMEFWPDMKEAPPGDAIQLIVFANKQGHFAGMDVSFCSNVYPIPTEMALRESPFFVHCHPGLMDAEAPNE